MYRLVHILTVSHSLIFLKDQLQFMQEKGFEISIIASSEDGFLEEFCQAEKVKHYAVPMKRSIAPKQDLSHLKKITRIIDSIQPHIVHSHTPKGGLLGMLGATIARVPIQFYHMRGLPFVAATKNMQFILRNTEKISCGLAHQVLCQSHSLREFAIRNNICSANKIAVLCEGSNGVDFQHRFNPNRFSPSMRSKIKNDLNIASSDQVIGYIGRITREKGILELQQAWRLIKQENPNVCLVIIGDIDSRDNSSSLYCNLFQNDPRVRFIQNTKNPENYYSIFDLFILPSYHEGFPNVLNEASSMELPIITSCVTGCIDAVEDKKTGLLVPPKNSFLLAKAIETYLHDAELRKTHGKAGRRRIEQSFSRISIWKALLQMYSRFLYLHGYKI